MRHAPAYSHRPPRPPHASRLGFSLVELVLCTLIIGMVAAIGVPRYANSLALARLNAAAQRVNIDIAYARERARATSAPVTLRFQIDLNVLDILEAPRLDDPGEAYRTRLDEDPYFCELDAADFGGNDTLIFDGYGQPDSAGSLRLVHGRHSRTLSLTAAGEVTTP